VPALELRTAGGSLNAGKLKSALRLVTTFLAGHGALQGLNIITGLFLIRALSIEAYAQYSLAMAFQITAVSLTNLGLTDSIIPLVGSQGKDLAIVGKYVRAARALRTRLFLLVAPCCAAAFYALVRSHHWSSASFAVLLISILASLYWSVSIACWSAPLILNHRLSDYYLGQLAATAARLVIYLVASIGRVLSAGFAAAVTAVSLLLNGAIAKRLAAPFVDMSQPVDPAAKREVLRFMLPMTPAAIFAAFQPQIALFLVSIAGQTLQIAQIAALSRIAQLFLVVNMFNSLVLEPFVARVSAERIATVYARVLGATLLLGALITSLAFAFPGVLLWLLGAKYQDLRAVIGWVVLASCMSSGANVVWVMNRARRWMFWRGSLLEIACLIVFQTAYVVIFGVRTTTTAALFMLAGGAAHLVTHVYVMIYGFSHHRYAVAPAPH
jgi:O-antigen/teichoic acid export membrane protein